MMNNRRVVYCYEDMQGFYWEEVDHLSPHLMIHEVYAHFAERVAAMDMQARIHWLEEWPSIIDRERGAFLDWSPEELKSPSMEFYNTAHKVCLPT